MHDILTKLEATIASRKSSAPDTSYTAALFHKGSDHIAKKLAEEAVECALASAKNDTANLTYEAADVLYHLLVLLQSHDLSLEDVCNELTRREGTSGIDEKNSRKG